MTDLRPKSGELAAAVVYAIATPVAIGLSFVFETLSIRAVNSLRGFPDWFGLALNVVPSVVAGAIVFGAAALASHHWIRGSIAARWLYRCAVPLLGASFLLIVLIEGTTSPDFWLFGQLVLWPAITLATGLIVEAVVTANARKRSHVPLPN